MTSTPERPILSVIIVTYQSCHEIGACLASIPTRIRDQPVEVIVADNLSVDGTPEFVAERFPAVQLLRLDANLGFSKANNRGLATSHGETILFLNPDTVVNLAALEACLLRLENEPRIGIISPRLEMGDGTIDPACRRSIPTIWDGFTRASGLAHLFPNSRWLARYNLTFLPERETYRVGAVNGAFMMMPRRVLDQVGVFDEQFFMYGEDLDLCLRCELAGFQVVYDGRHTVIHYKGRSSAKNYQVWVGAAFYLDGTVFPEAFQPAQFLVDRVAVSTVPETLVPHEPLSGPPPGAHGGPAAVTGSGSVRAAKRVGFYRPSLSSVATAPCRRVWMVSALPHGDTAPWLQKKALTQPKIVLRRGGFGGGT